MTEIEKCVCGGGLECVNPEVSAYPSAKRTYCVMCYSNCWRRGPEKDTKEAAIAAWNSDQRGLRLLREVYDLGERQNAALEAAMDDPSDENIDKMTLISDERTALNIQVRAWAEEGDR